MTQPTRSLVSRRVRTLRSGHAGRWLGVTLSLTLCLVAPAAPAQARQAVPARHTTPSRAAPLQPVTDLLQALLPGLFPSAPTSALPPAVRDRVATSTVRVSGPACGTVRIGSGFSARTDMAVTAAHVVAGVTRPEVLTPDGRRLPASVVAFDPDRDLAVLRVASLGQSPLALARAANGTQGAVFGHPNGQVPVEVSPATVTGIGTVRLPNLYGAPTVREILRLSTQLDSGDSGGPVVDTTGAVVGVAFAISTIRANEAYAVTSQELEPVLNGASGTPVSTGRCID